MMIVLKDCPNCGSFDITTFEVRNDPPVFNCHACGDEWVEVQECQQPDAIDWSEYQAYDAGERPGQLLG